MTYSTTLTSKGQMTIPANFRKKLGIKPGERVLVEMHGDKVIVQKNNWRDGLNRIRAENRAYLDKKGIKPLTDEELDNAINTAAQAAATERYDRSLES